MKSFSFFQNSNCWRCQRIWNWSVCAQIFQQMNHSLRLLSHNPKYAAETDIVAPLFTQRGLFFCCRRLSVSRHRIQCWWGNSQEVCLNKSFSLSKCVWNGSTWPVKWGQNHLPSRQKTRHIKSERDWWSSVMMQEHSSQRRDGNTSSKISCFSVFRGENRSNGVWHNPEMRTFLQPSDFMHSRNHKGEQLLCISGRANIRCWEQNMAGSDRARGKHHVSGCGEHPCCNPLETGWETPPTTEVNIGLGDMFFF